jgi:hypothetical protein
MTSVGGEPLPPVAGRAAEEDEQERRLRACFRPVGTSSREEEERLPTGRDEKKGGARRGMSKWPAGWREGLGIFPFVCPGKRIKVKGFGWFEREVGWVP